MNFRGKYLVLLFAGLSLLGCAAVEPEAEEEELQKQPREIEERVEAEVEAQVAEREEQLREEIRTDLKKELRDEQEPEQEEQIREEIVTEAEGINHVEAEEAGDNVILTLQEQILFGTLQAEIKRSAMPVLDEIAKLLLEYPDRMVIVAGHADTMPVQTERFPSNWDLSAQRAVNTVKYISYLEELDNSRLIAAGFGEYHPVAPNDTPENRRLNRRVEFILLPPGLEQKDIEVPLDWR